MFSAAVNLICNDEVSTPNFGSGEYDASRDTLPENLFSEDPNPVFPLIPTHLPAECDMDAEKPYSLLHLLPLRTAPE